MFKFEILQHICVVNYSDRFNGESDYLNAPALHLMLYLLLQAKWRKYDIDRKQEYKKTRKQINKS